MLKRFQRRLRHRYESLAATLPPIDFHLGAALRKAFRKGYGVAHLRADLLAGLTVGIVALPLSMALAIAVGVPPQYGLYTAIVGGGLIALLGGSKMQVSGPTAAFVVILVPIVAQYGLAGLLTATLMAGVILIVLGYARMGRMIQFVPDPVVTGFTAGIAVVIATLQVKDFLGLSVEGQPEHYWERVGGLVDALPTFAWPECAIAALTLALLLLWPRLMPKVPAPLVALTVASLAAVALDRLLGLQVHTIGSTFTYMLDGRQLAGIPQLPPTVMWPWQAGDGLALTFDTVQALLPAAFAIAILGAIESLLSAVVADGMAGTSHDPDGELIAQGLGNVAAPFFGGFACTGALARTATNIRAGARSPLAAVFHALFVLAAVLLLAPLLAYLPMASFAALLLVVAWNMSDARHFAHILRVAPKSDVTVMLACFALTVLFDMVVAVSAGIVLAALLFIRRMAEVTGASLLEDGHPALATPLPAGVLLYEIHGPLFFGAANKAMASLGAIGKEGGVVILDVSQVPAIDATGLVNLESALARLARDGAAVVIAGLQEQPSRSLEKAGLVPVEGKLAFANSIPAAVETAKTLLGRSAAGTHAPRQGATS
jgi:sulfate permease, SulP family